MGASVRNEFGMESKVGEDFLGKEFCYSFGGDGFVTGREDYPLRKPVVDHDHDRVKTIRGWEICDKIDAKLGEGVCFGRRNGR